MNETEFDARVRALEGRLYRIAHAMLRSDADCADAIQNAVFAAWRRLGTLKNADAFEPWLCRILVNTCRGEIYNQADLIAALESGKVGGYATDVVEGEPIDGNHVLLKTPNVIVTPHLGGYSVVSLRGMGQTMVDDMRRIFVEGGFPGVIANPKIDLANSRIVKFREAA